MNELLKKYIKGDRIIWYVILLLSVFSCLVVYSATGNLAYKHQDGNSVYYLFRHAKFLLLGIGIIIAVHHIDYKWFARFATVFLYFSIVLLVITAVSGVSLNQASRWLTVPVVGISFQPSELAKLALMIYIAKVLAQYQANDRTADEAFKPIMIHVAIVCGLIFKDDFSTAALIGFTSWLVMMIGRVSLKYLFSTVAAVLLFVMIVLWLSDYVPILHRASTWKARIERFVDDEPETMDAGGSSADYQSERSQIAIATGGVFMGRGPGNSQQRYFLPHPYSDFVYAIIIEEWGILIGGFLIMFAYLILLFRAGVIVRASSRTFPAFLVIGLSTLLVVQAFINMGVAVGVMPVTGQPLPLVSMGGTSTLFTCLAFGAILSVSRNNMEEKELATQEENE
ncbi:FtsW/RodA/SpoVE family cell cycle protein [Carboxylicivirga sediminis]|uniref:Probable peptidoglycan glycosyltransferase FtsW n=1 Tax=Carboxylicivirga sediminis TaxID=2006564 RepID=A0A941F7Z9_9BACT|nr:FtsW/RodA/SpoVE family cell cycle protein [Carboxylicivirga sediminis]MBR8538052.1 FtsW/RodA/SpoVE family cell cycle protein [Carboxylicivirga sediminis]